MAENNWRLGEFDGVHHRGRGGMGEVDGHADIVHAVDNLDAELTKSAGIALIHAVADVVLAVVGDARQPDAHGVELVDALQAVTDGQML